MKPFLTGNALKLIAAFCMLLDHAGLLLFPGAGWMRVLGRLAYPIYAFMIAEDCRYTRSKARYFWGIAILAAVCQAVYYIADGTLYFSILVTFSLSILMIYALQKNRLLFLLAVAGVYVLNHFFTIDYGFWGCMVPVFAALFHGKGELDQPQLHIGMLGLGLVLLAMESGGIQWWSLAALPLLLLYNGKRGRLRMKYFFYIFYPLHLALLQLIAWLVL